MPTARSLTVRTLYSEVQIEHVWSYLWGMARDSHCMVKGTRTGGLMYGEVTNGNMGNGHR